MEIIESNLEKLRKHANLTRKKLADEIGVTENTIYNWEKGNSGLSTLVSLIKLCDFLDCNLKDLISVKSIPDNKPLKINSNNRLQTLRELLSTNKKSLTSDTKLIKNEIESTDKE